MTWIMGTIGVVLGLASIVWFEFRRADCLSCTPFEGFSYTWADAFAIRNRTRQCRHFPEYKAIYPPRCGCDACNKKWSER